MTIEAQVLVTHEELMAIVTEVLADKCHAGRSYGKLPEGRVTKMACVGSSWVIQWGNPLQEPIPVVDHEGAAPVVDPV